MFCLCWRSLRSHGANFAIKPPYNTHWEIQPSLFTHRVIDDEQNHGKQMKYTALLAAALFS